MFEQIIKWYAVEEALPENFVQKDTRKEIRVLMSDGVKVFYGSRIKKAML